MGDVDTTPDGLYYMPRALWSAAYPSSAGGLTQVRYPFNRQHFRNGSRWPVQLQRIALTAINYPIDTTTDVATLGNAIISNTTAGVLYGARLKISAPFRKKFSRMDLHLGSMSPKPTMPPEPRAYNQSSLFGLSYLRFDRPLYLPKNGHAEMSLSNLDVFAYTGDIGINFPNDPVTVRAFWHEGGGNFFGASRQKDLTLNYSDVANDQNPDDGYPYPRPSAFGAFTGISPIGFWGPAGNFAGREFLAQNATQAGSTSVYGLGCMVDQIDFDDDTETVIVAAGGAANSTRMSMMASRIGCRARVSSGPSTGWWWRPGAPMSLVLDTVTPAVVYELPEPITLNPSQTLEVELSMPVTNFLDGFPDSAGTFPERYQFGISFNGYSVIEG